MRWECCLYTSAISKFCCYVSSLKEVLSMCLWVGGIHGKEGGVSFCRFKNWILFVKVFYDEVKIKLWIRNRSYYLAEMQSAWKQLFSTYASLIVIPYGSSSRLLRNLLPIYEFIRRHIPCKTKFYQHYHKNVIFFNIYIYTYIYISKWHKEFIVDILLTSFLYEICTFEEKEAHLTDFEHLFDICVTVHLWYNNINSQLEATVIILLIISISSTCLGR